MSDPPPPPPPPKTAKGSFKGSKKKFTGRFYLPEGIKDLEGTFTEKLEDFESLNATITYEDAADLDGPCDILEEPQSFIGFDEFEVTLITESDDPDVPGGVVKIRGVVRPPIDSRSNVTGKGTWTPGQE